MNTSHLWTNGQWRDWFAWRPIRLLDGRWAWLKTVRRRRVHMHPDGHVDWFMWEFAERRLSASGQEGSPS